MLKLKFKSQLWLGNSIVFLLMIIIASTIHINIGSLISISNQVTLTQDVVGQSEIMQKTVRDLQTGIRGFLISGHDDFLTPYNEGQKRLEEVMETTRSMLNSEENKEELIKLLNNLHSDIQKWHEVFAQPAIALRREVSKTVEVTTHFEDTLESGIGERKREEMTTVLQELRTKAQAKHDTQIELLILTIENDILRQQTLERGFLISGRENLLELYQQNLTVLQEHLTSLEQCFVDDTQATQSIHTIKELEAEWMKTISEPLIAAKEKMSQHTKTLEDIVAFVETGEDKRMIDGILKQFDTFNQIGTTLLSQHAEKSKAIAHRAVTVTKFGTLFALITGIIVIFFLTRNIVRITNNIVQSSFAVNKAANEITQGNINLSQRTEQQASSLEETAASLEQMTSIVQQNTDNTQQAAQLAIQARKVAQKGGEIVESTVMSMVETNKSSKQVADIIAVIDEIAFQTNLLALNAAVEAARAGEQGRGFAVVAAEVRSLAQRSATAAKEIKKLIQNSVSKVEEGTHSVNQSGEALQEIVTSVKKVNDIIIEIASASQEQSSGIKQINDAIIQLDQITQQNGALMEESTAASESLRDQARMLEEYVMFFGTAKREETTPYSHFSSVQKHRVVKQKPPTERKASTTDSEWQEF